MRALALVLLLAACAKEIPVVAPDAEARGEKPGKPRNVQVYEAR